MMTDAITIARDSTDTRHRSLRFATKKRALPRQKEAGVSDKGEIHAK
jgi:hypothetical protein